METHEHTHTHTYFWRKQKPQLRSRECDEKEIEQLKTSNSQAVLHHHGGIPLVSTLLVRYSDILLLRLVIVDWCEVLTLQFALFVWLLGASSS